MKPSPSVVLKLTGDRQWYWEASQHCKVKLVRGALKPAIACTVAVSDSNLPQCLQPLGACQRGLSAAAAEPTCSGRQEDRGRQARNRSPLGAVSAHTGVIPWLRPPQASHQPDGVREGGHCNDLRVLCSHALPSKSKATFQRADSAQQSWESRAGPKPVQDE